MIERVIIRRFDSIKWNVFAFMLVFMGPFNGEINAQVDSTEFEYVSVNKNSIQLSERQSNRLVRSYSKKIHFLTSRLRSANNKYLHAYMKEEDALLHSLCDLMLPPDFKQKPEVPQIIASGEGFSTETKSENLDWLNKPSIKIERPSADVLADGLMMDCWYNFNRFENKCQREGGLKPLRKSHELDSVNLVIAEMELKYPEKKSDFSFLRKMISALEYERKRTELIRNYINEQQEYLHDVLSGVPGAALMMKPLQMTSGYFNAQIKENFSLFNDRSKLQDYVLQSLNIKSKELFSVSGMDQIQGVAAKSSAVLKGDSGELMTIEDLLSGANSKVPKQEAVTEVLRTNLPLGNENTEKGKESIEAFDQINGANSTVKNDAVKLKDKSDQSKVELNPLKTKRIIDRFKVNFNFQLDPSTRFFPSSGTVTVGLGYQYHPSGNIGASLLYNQPLPKGVFNSETRNLLPYSTGYGIRTFADFRLKGNVFLICGYDWMKKAKTMSNADYVEKPELVQSALAGLKIKTKIKSKRTSPTLEILYDFLHRSTGQPAIVTRIGFEFNRKHGVK